MISALLTISILLGLCFNAHCASFVNCGGSVPGDGIPLQDHRPVLGGVDVMKYWGFNRTDGAFHTNDLAVYGDFAYAFNYKGFQFWFADAASRSQFQSNPSAYAPSFGGFGSLGVGTEPGPTASPPGNWPWSGTYLGPPVDVNTGWSIINGKLLLTSRQSYRNELELNYQSVLATAFSRWVMWFGSADGGPFNSHCLTYGDNINYCIDKVWPDSWGWSPGGSRFGGAICVNGQLNTDPFVAPPVVDAAAGPVNKDGLNRREVGLICGIFFSIILNIGLCIVVVMIARRPHDVVKVN